MNKQKSNREIVKFVADEPVTVVLDTDPSTAKSTTRETQWGPKTSYTYFTGDNRVMFPSQALHERLSRYNNGDTVTITLVDGKNWLVVPSGIASETKVSIGNEESIVLLRKIANDVDLIKSHIFNKNENKDTKPIFEKATEVEEDIEF